MNARSLSTSIVTVLLCTSVAAQTSGLSGVVTEEDTGRPLPGAHVVLHRGDTDTGAVTGIDGTYSLGSLHAGSYEVVVSFVGFQSQTFSLTLAEDERRVVDVELELSAVEINPVTVTASRGAEKLLDAPSSITVLEQQEIEGRTGLTVAEHLKGVPAVDMVTTGINQSRVVIRGFNDNLASSLLTLVDNRITRIPSIRLTALQLVPLGGYDVERIEVVSGPASALYGPNAANGVVHIITKSPFESRGTVASFGIGQNDILSGALRHAGTWGDRVGYKFSTQIYRGDDFEFYDPIETELRESAIAGGADPDTLLIGRRDFRVENFAFDGRLDYRFSDRGTLIGNFGITTGTNIETSPTGAVQAKNAKVLFGQLRFLYDRLWAQLFVNKMNSGDSYALRTGELFTDKSLLFVGQVQHYSTIGSRQSFTYGADVFLTRPDSDGNVHGQNEDRDNINEVGAYVQSQTSLTSKLEMLLAARLDYHNVMDDVTFSPRAALVYKPVPSHTVRATYNHAFQTPTANQFFTDILGVRDLFEGQRLEPLLGFAPTTDLRAQGVPGGGFSFRRDPFGAPMFRSPYARLGGLSESDYIGLNDESFTNVMWSVARDASVAGLGVGFVDQGLLTSEEAEAVSGALATVLPLQVEGVTNALFKLDLEREGFVPVNDVESIEPLRVSRTQTYELGYKGVLGDRVFFGIDVYHTRVRDFFGPFAVATPNVFLDGTTLQSELYNDLQVALSDPENAEAAEALAVFDTMPGIGNGNGSAADEVSFLVGRALAAAIPFGTVSPEQAFDETAVLLTRQNFGNISLNGLDFNVMYHVTRRWALGGTFSWVSDNYFDHNELGDDDPTQAVSLNAPRQKYSASVRYTDPGLGFAAELRGRYVGEFPVRSDVYIGTVDAYTVVDLSVDYRVPFSPNTRLTLTVQNVLDNEHKEFVDVPDLGRLGLLRISHAF